MRIAPVNWNVVVVGGWNRAILTPIGVAEHVFRVPRETPLEIEVPLDQAGPCKVKHDGISVMAASNRLTLAPDSSSYQDMEKALQCATNAVKSLPKTPLSAAGFNIRFDVHEAPLELLDLLKGKLDEVLSDSNMIVEAWTITRRLRFGGGQANLEIAASGQDEVAVQINFHRGSREQEDLLAWLSQPLADVKQLTGKILKSLTGMNPDE